MSTIHGIGCDIVSVERIERVFRHPTTWTSVFTSLEISYIQRFDKPQATLAGHFAAKEAVVKALGTGFRQGIGFHDIEISHDELGKPQVTLSDTLCLRWPRLKILLSISHEKAFAVAYAIALYS